MELLFAAVNRFPGGYQPIHVGQLQDRAVKRHVCLGHVVGDADPRGPLQSQSNAFLSGFAIRSRGNSGRGISSGETLDLRPQFSDGADYVCLTSSRRHRYGSRNMPNLSSNYALREQKRQIERAIRLFACSAEARTYIETCAANCQ